MKKLAIGIVSALVFSTSVMAAPLVDRSEYEADQARQDKNLNTFKDGVKTWNEWASKDSSDQWKDINELHDTKANKKDLVRETKERESADATLNAAVNQKVDKDVFAADQKRQDGRLNTVENMTNGLNHVVGENKQDIAELNQNKLDKSEYASDKDQQQKLNHANEIRRNANESALTAEADERISVDAKLQANIDANVESQKETDSTQNSAISTNSKNINTESTERKASVAATNERIDQSNTVLDNHNQRITSNTNRVGAVEQRQQNFENSTNQRFSDMGKRVEDNRKVASAGIAGAGAMASIPGLSNNSDFSVGAGIGGYDSEQAVAVGFSARITDSVTTKANVSTNTQSEVLWGAGVGLEW